MSSLFEGQQPATFILLALSVALAGYNILFLHNLFRAKKTQKGEKIIKLLKPQVLISLGIMFLLIMRIIFNKWSSVGCIEAFALILFLVLWFLMCWTAIVSYYGKKEEENNKTDAHIEIQRDIEGRITGIIVKAKFPTDEAVREKSV